jgi:hypothetical protein
MAPVPKSFQPAALRRYPGRTVDLEAPMRVVQMFERPMVLVQTKDRGVPVTIPVAPEELHREIDVQWRDYFPYELDRSGAFPHYVGPGQPIPGISGVRRRRKNMRGVGATAVEFGRRAAVKLSQPDQFVNRIDAPQRAAKRVDFTLLPSVNADSPTFARGGGMPAPARRYIPAYQGGAGAFDENGEQAVGAVAGGLVLGLILVGGYFAGAAMAPDPKRRVGWGVAGSLLGFFTGPIGLGAMGLVRVLKG